LSEVHEEDIEDIEDEHGCDCDCITCCECQEEDGE